MGAAVPRVVTPTSASGAQVIDGSLRFDLQKKDGLSFQPPSHGNKKTSTIAGWFKRGGNSPSNAQSLFTVSQDTNSDYFEISLSDNRFKVYNRSDGQNSGTAVNIWTSSYLRDFSGWYHFVVVLDSTQSTTSDRLKIYINGIRHLSFTNDDYPSQNYKFFSSTGGVEERGISQIFWTGGTTPWQQFDGSMSQVYFIDGQALGPENFGYTDPLTNTWRPKKYTGNYNVSEKINLSLTQNNEAIDVVVNRVVDKCWVKSNGRWLGGGNPSDVSSTPTFNILTGEAAANLYWATTAYDNTYEVTIGTSSETGTQPQWDDSSGSWNIVSTSVVSGTFGSSYGHARTGAMTDGNVYAFTYTINADNVACNHGGWFITDEASIASYGATVPDEQTSLNSVGARWYRGSYTLGYWTHVGVYNDFLDINEYSDDGSYTMLGGGGVNSFYLPFDGNTPIGNDKSKPIPLNRGETWSSSLSSIDGFGRAGYGPEKAFNGVLTTTDFASSTNYGANKTLTFGPSPAITYNATVEIMTRNTSVATVTFNGTTFLATDLQWQLIATGPGTISDSNTIVIDSESSSEYATLSGIRVDGVVLINDTYGNGWTPVNFGGSAALDKATGALPILNTVSGGEVATVGVRTDTSPGNGPVGVSTYCVLALPLVGIDDDVSNRINSGTTTKVMTSVGTAAASTLQSNFYSGSFLFDGNSDYLTTPASSDFNFAGGDYTIEWWQWWNNISGYQAAFDCGYTDTDSLLVQSGNGDGKYTVYAQGDTVLTESVAAVVQKWTHYALVRNGTSIILYRDGALSGSATHSGSTHGSSTHTFIVASSEGGYEFNGYMQDFRVYKGVAKYTTDFIPASTNPDIFLETPSGVALSSQLTKVTDGAVVFGGPGTPNPNHYLTISDSADFTFGTGDFTLEAFVNYSDNGTWSSFIMKYTTNAASSSWFWGMYQGLMTIYIYYGSSWVTVASTTPFPENAWVHCVVTRDGNTVRSFQNGVLVATGDITGQTVNDTSVALTIGSDGDQNYDLNGFVSNARIIKGDIPTDYQTTSTTAGTKVFTPPSAPLTNVTNTKLLCCQSNTQPGAAVVAPLVSGINNGTQWSALTTADAAWTRGPSLAFNGGYVDNDGNTTAHPTGTNKTITCNFTGQGLSGNVKIFGYTVSSGSAYQQVKFDDGSWINLIGSSTGYYWFDAGDQGSFDIMYTKGINGGGAYLGGVEVAGTVLRDPLTPNGNPVATTFNPFTTDIKTVMGQETGYCTWNPLTIPTNTNYSDGNLILNKTGTSHSSSYATMGMTTGKWYWEISKLTSTADGGLGMGLVKDTQLSVSDAVSADDRYCIYLQADTIYYYDGDTTELSFASTSTFNDNPGTFMFAFDADNQKLYFGKDGSWTNGASGLSGGDPSAGSGALLDGFNAGETYFPWCTPYNSGQNMGANFGQKPLKYAPPEGYKLLNYANLPSPGVVRSDKVVTATKWTSTGGSSTYDVDCRLAPDLIWHKCYDGSQNNSVFTSILGPDSRLDTSGNSGEQDWHPAYFTGFTHNGYGVSSTSSDLNPAAGAKMISYCWKAGGSKGTFNKDGIVYASAADAGLDGGSATPSASSVGTKQGFSIIKVAGSNTASKTFSHGLSQAPTFAIGKLLAAAPSNSTDQDWQVYHKWAMGNTKGLQLNLSTTEETSSALWNNNYPDDTLFSIGASTRWEGNFIMYLWHDVPGLQRFGTYNANGSDANGPFVYLGFRPAIIMLMCYSGSGENRYIYSDKAGEWQSSTANPNYSPSFLNDNAAANTSTTGYRVDFLSNGFRLRQSNGPNTSSPASKYLYAAWAHQPLQNLYGVQSNAY
ncbi:MAG: hypothetical protein CL606_03735 [Anaerolineaceae bacterium]|nr:hypothetical protein [Anaerolineaceae bacterium]